MHSEEEKVRFSAWFTGTEMAAIRKIARDHGVNNNLVVRSAVQHLIAAAKANGVTLITRNIESEISGAENGS